MKLSPQTRKCLANRTTVFIIAMFSFQHGSTKGDSTIWLRKSVGEFTSEGYPDLDDGMYCTWKILAPQNHKITIHFLEFELLEIWFCKDKLEIYDGDIRLGTYRGTELRRQSITSTSNTMRVILDTCSPSLWWDRKGIHVSYTTVYPTTLARETTKKMTTTRSTTATRSSTATRSTTATRSSTATQSSTASSFTTTVTESFSTQISTMQSSPATFTPTSLSVFEQTSHLPSLSSNKEYAFIRASVWNVGVLLAGLVSIVIFVIISIFIVKRKCARSNVAIRVGDANHGQVDLCTVVTESTAQEIYEINYDYVQGCESQEDRNFKFSSQPKSAKTVSAVRSCRLQKKHPKLKSNTEQCVYANDAGDTYGNTDAEEEYSTKSCKEQPTSVNIVKNDIESKQNLDCGTVINVAYEPYLPKM